VSIGDDGNSKKRDDMFLKIAYHHSSKKKGKK